MANNPIAIDASDLQYYDKQIKNYIEDKDAEVKASLSSSLNDLREEINKISNKADLNESAIKAANVHIDENEADIENIRENIIPKIAAEVADLRTDIEVIKEASKDYATTEYVKDKIREAQLEAGDIDLSDYAKVSDIDALNKRIDDQNDALTSIHTEIDNVQNNLEEYITESELAARNYATLDKLESYATKDYVADAISNIPAVNLSNYATKTELEAVQRVAGENSVKLFAIESDLFDIEKKLETIPSIEGLASEQFVLDKISEIEIPDTSSFATKEDLDNLATVEYINNNYISNTEAEKFVTHSELEEAVTEVVDKHFEETVIVHVDEEIEKKLAENQTINYGTFGEV